MIEVCNVQLSNQTIMKTISTICLLFVSTIIFGQSSKWVAPDKANSIKNPIVVTDKVIKSGKKLFVQMCAICHGNSGKGDGMAGMSLTPRPSNFTKEMTQSQTDGAIYWKMTQGRSPMASYKDILTEEQRWQLVSYIRTFKK